jgi:dephospho-CoA kinase
VYAVVSDLERVRLANFWFRNSIAPLILVRSTQVAEVCRFAIIYSTSNTNETDIFSLLLSHTLINPFHPDADSIAHTVYRPGSQAVKDVAEAFASHNVVDSNGEIDRRKLGSIVFGDIKDMQKLERIVWPHVKQDILDQIETVRDEWNGDGSPIVVVEAAVLLDAGWQDVLNGVLVVTASPRVALARLVESRGLSKEEAEKRMAAQLSRRGIGNLDEEVRNKVVTAVIDNSGSLDDLQQALSQTLCNASTWYL